MNVVTPMDFFGSPRNELKRQAIEIQDKFITSNAIFFGNRVTADQRCVGFKPWEFCIAHDDAAKFSLITNKIEETELRPELFLFEQDEARIEANEISSIPIAMIVALARQPGLVPFSETVGRL